MLSIFLKIVTTPFDHKNGLERSALKWIPVFRKRADALWASEAPANADALWASEAAQNADALWASEAPPKKER